MRLLRMEVNEVEQRGQLWWMCRGQLTCPWTSDSQLEILKVF
jgi:hypothetical protein